MAPQIVFLRGLSTYGHDDAQLSFVKLGPVHRKLGVELVRHGVEFHPVLGMGAGSLGEVAARAVRALERMPAWTNDRPVHLVGHSAGGLVARLVLAELGHRRLSDGRPKIASVLSVATPHAGSGLADIFVRMPHTHRRHARLFRALGYDVSERRDFFYELTKPAVDRALAHVAEARATEVRTGSIVCAPPRRRWSVPMRAFHALSVFRQFDEPSDGMVERDAQVFGTDVFEVPLDHFQQAGFFGARTEFRRLGEVIADFARG